MLFFNKADNGGPVARGKAPFLCTFLDIEISKLRKDLLLIIFCHKLNLISGENSLLKEMLSLHRNHLFYSICNCQHSVERKFVSSLFELAKIFFLISIFLTAVYLALINSYL